MEKGMQLFNRETPQGETESETNSEISRFY